MALRFTELEHADIIRDGGSYEARLIDDGGNHVLVRLAIAADPSPPGILRHRGLYVEGLSGRSGEHRIERRSSEERNLLSALLQLASSLEASSDQLEDRQQDALERLYQFLAYAKTRRA